jgi:peptidoglycan/LPS O-acetylase OafA/YrhL
MKIDSKKRVIGFDIARVVSIIIIVLYHSLGYGSSYYSHPSIRSIGYASLAIFTFQSGFLLATRYDLQTCSFFSFIKARLLRIWPLFLISSILLCLMGFNSWFNTAKAWFGVSSFWSPAPRTMWYVGLLIFLYIGTLFWAKGGIVKQIIKFIITMGVIVGIELVFHSVDSRTFVYTPVYFLGIIIGQYYNEKFFSFITTPKYIIILLMLYVGLLIVEVFKNNLLLMWANSMIGMVALMSFYVYLGEKWKNNKGFISKLSMLSYATFCIYLFHREIFEGLLILWTPSSQYQLVPYLSLLGLAIVIPLAYYIQKGYDGILKKMNLL